MEARLVSGGYAGRGTAHASRRDAEARRSAGIGRARLVVFLMAAGTIVWAVANGPEPVALGAAALLLTIFVGLVVWHARVERRAAWHEALRVASGHAQARVDRRWHDLPAAPAPAGIDLAQHPYALDLDLFGRASLFQWLGPTATAGGGVRLAQWLLAPAAPEALSGRQAAVTELASRDEWCEAFAAHGVLARAARDADLDAFLIWAESPPAAHIPLKVATALILAATGLLLVDAAGGWWMVPMLIGVVLSFAMASRLHQSMERAGAGEEGLSRYAALLAHVAGAPFESEVLRTLQARLSTGGLDADEWMRRLSRVLGFGALRTSAALLHFPIQTATLWDFHVYFALDRWRRVAGGHARGWLAALADLDALAALAAPRRDHPDWADGQLNSLAVMSARGLGHPLLPESRRVVNDVAVGPPGTLLLVTGSNMSGKSTLLRSIGLNIVLAQAGGPVCAASFRMPPIDLQTSIRIQDSLELGLSYFMAALARLKGVVDAAERPRDGRVLCYLLDEILQGTNSVERGIAVRGVARHLLAAHAIGVMTTHDLNLAGEEPLQSSARLVHFTELIDPDGSMRFDYRLRDGLATSRNALRLMKMIGISVEGS